MFFRFCFFLLFRGNAAGKGQAKRQVYTKLNGLPDGRQLRLLLALKTGWPSKLAIKTGLL